MIRLTHCVLTVSILAVALAPTGAPAAHRTVPPKAALPALQTPAPTGRIVIKFSEQADVTVTGAGLVSRKSATATRLRGLIADIAPTARLERRFSRPAAAIAAERAAAEARLGRSLPDLNRYAQLEGAAPASDRQALLDIVRKLAADPAVETAFLEPVAVPAALGFDAFTGATPAGDGRTKLATPAEGTPDYSGLQGYLGAPPAGINALAMADTAGADGSGVKVIDVEGAWLWAHEDLPDPFAAIGGEIPVLSWRNHGTAVLGEIRGTDNGFGVRGIAPACSVGASSIALQWTANAINNAAALLNPGDIILIELHSPGPNATGEGQYGYIAMEFWQDNFDAILLATAAGVIVCEAAGNGQQDLDDPVYLGLFDRNVRDSGAIVCGATDGSSLDPAYFTNYGSRVDLHGWGFQVTTCGYGSLQGSPDFPEEQWYSDTFSGTSSASPIVVGAVASLQGMVKQNFGMPLDARLARDILYQTGTPQNGTNHIGPRPNLAAAWTLASGGIGEVAGIVTDGGTALPVEGIEVRVAETGGFDLSGADGGYRLSLLTGSYNLSFQSFYYQTASAPVTILNGVTTELNVALTLKPTVDITGRVYGGIAMPLVGARVTPQLLPVPGTVTAAGGNYTLAAVPIEMDYLLLYDGLPGYGAHVQSVSSAVPAGSQVPVFVNLPHADMDFEIDDGGFVADSLWSWGGPAAGGPTGGFSGANCWGIGMTGNYPDDAAATLTSQVFNFGYTPIYHLHLSFHFWSETEAGFDGVQLQTSTGAGWETRTPMEGYSDATLSGLAYGPGWSGSSGGWHGTVFDLTDLIGPDFQFRLLFGSDGGVDGPGFWIDDIAWDDGSIMTAVDGDGEIPAKVEPALSAFPNPFNPATSIAWRNVAPGRLRVEIYDLRGRLVRRLLDERASASSGNVLWNGRDDADRAAASGVYVVRLQSSGGSQASRRISLVQ